VQGTHEGVPQLLKDCGQPTPQVQRGIKELPRVSHAKVSLKIVFLRHWHPLNPCGYDCSCFENENIEEHRSHLRAVSSNACGRNGVPNASSHHLTSLARYSSYFSRSIPYLSGLMEEEDLGDLGYKYDVVLPEKLDTTFTDRQQAGFIPCMPSAK
jgi:hypothetical protein